MINISGALFVFSFLVLIVVFFKKEMKLASNFMIYAFFSLLYTLFPFLTFCGIEPSIWFRHFSLNESELLITTQTIIMSLCNLVFAFIYYLKYQKPVSPVMKNEKRGSTLIFIFYCLFCLGLIYWGFKSSYVNITSESEHSLISNFKAILAGVYLFYIVQYGINYRVFFMFIGFVILLLVEQSRWYFISVLIGSSLYLQNEKNVSNKVIICILLVFLILLSWVGLYRSNVVIEDYTLILNPFFIEGDYGSYMILQTYDLFYRGKIEFYTFFSDYLFDPLLYFIPRPIFMIFDVDKEAIGIFKYFVSYHEGFLNEEYAPVGGFHYLAQASSALPFIGPLVITYLFSILTVKIDNNIYKSKFHNLTYYLYSSGFMFVFIKTIFHQTIKYYFTLAVPAYVLFFLLRKTKIIIKK